MAARELRRLSGDPLSATRAKFYGAGIVIVEPKPFYQRLFAGKAVAGAWQSRKHGPEKLCASPQGSARGKLRGAKIKTVHNLVDGPFGV